MLYARLLGTSWQLAAEPVRIAHAAGTTTRAHGRLRIEHGRTPVARVLAWLLRLPRANPAAETELIILTLTDFVVEIAVRKQLGDVYAGERVTHAIMGILYGAMIAKLIPTLSVWWALPTGLVVDWVEIPPALRWGLLAMAAGVFVSGLRDLYAALEFAGGSWPWKPEMPAAVKR